MLLRIFASLIKAFAPDITIPAADEQRAQIEALARNPSLDGELMQVRARLQRAGIRVYVEEHEIVRIEFGVVE